MCHVVMTSYTKPNSAAVNMASDDENRPSRMNTDVPSTSGSTHYQKLHSEQVCILISWKVYTNLYIVEATNSCQFKLLSEGTPSPLKMDGLLKNRKWDSIYCCLKDQTF